jgi:hypothetical protein
VPGLSAEDGDAAGGDAVTDAEALTEGERERADTAQLSDKMAQKEGVTP